MSATSAINGPSVRDSHHQKEYVVQEHVLLMTCSRGADAEAAFAGFSAVTLPGEIRPGSAGVALAADVLRDGGDRLFARAVNANRDIRARVSGVAARRSEDGSDAAVAGDDRLHAAPGSSQPAASSISAIMARRCSSGCGSPQDPGECHHDRRISSGSGGGLQATKRRFPAVVTPAGCRGRRRAALR